MSKGILTSVSHWGLFQISSRDLMRWKTNTLLIDGYLALQRDEIEQILRECDDEDGG